MSLYIEANITSTDRRGDLAGPTPTELAADLDPTEVPVPDGVELPGDRWVPVWVIEKYAARAANHGTARQLDNGTWFAEVVGLQGVWTDGNTPEEALAGLADQIFDWALSKLQNGATDIPPIDGEDLSGL